SGFIQREIQDAAYEAQLAVEREEAIVVGVNRFTVETEPPRHAQSIDPAIESAQVERLRAVRASRDATRCEQALAAVEAGAAGSDNLLPLILAAVEAYATVGEISNRLRSVFGEYAEALTV
ncbi:MAG: methylmalonyl-CoA mutase, partial [Acidobacteria bacterium]|nr:methylmalonyl-CoA mutase [Acidobacteriota bacterium]